MACFITLKSRRATDHADDVGWPRLFRTDSFGYLASQSAINEITAIWNDPHPGKRPNSSTEDDPEKTDFPEKYSYVKKPRLEERLDGEIRANKAYEISLTENSNRIKHLESVIIQERKEWASLQLKHLALEEEINRLNTENNNQLGFVKTQQKTIDNVCIFNSVINENNTRLSEAIICQIKSNQELRKRITQKDQQVAQRDEKITQKDEEIAQQYEEILQKSKEIAQSDEEIARRHTEIVEQYKGIFRKDMEIAQKNEEMAREIEEHKKLRMSYERRKQQIQRWKEDKENLEEVVEKLQEHSEGIKRERLSFQEYWRATQHAAASIDRHQKAIDDGNALMKEILRKQPFSRL